MKKNQVLAAMLLTIFLNLPTLALAKPQVSVDMQAQKEVVVVEEGQKKLKIVPATEIAPGETIIYSLVYSNAGDEAATNVLVNNPLPEGTVYLPGTASEEGVQLNFSIDGGQSYDRPEKLIVEEKQEDGTTVKRPARPEEYTHIRWSIERIGAGETGRLSYRVRVK